MPLREGRTLHHDIVGRYGAGEVIVRAAPPGTGIIAGGPMRAIFEALGVQDVVAKSVGTSNPHNMIKATFEALAHATSPRAVAARRGKKVSDILGRAATPSKESAIVANAPPAPSAEGQEDRHGRQTGSPIGRQADQEATLKGLGLNKTAPLAAPSRTRPRCAA